MFLYGLKSLHEIPLALISEIILLNGIVSIFAAYYFRKFEFLASVGIHFWDRCNMACYLGGDLIMPPLRLPQHKRFALQAHPNPAFLWENLSVLYNGLYKEKRAGFLLRWER